MLNKNQEPVDQYPIQIDNSATAPSDAGLTVSASLLGNSPFPTLNLGVVPVDAQSTTNAPNLAPTASVSSDPAAAGQSYVNSLTNAGLPVVDNLSGSGDGGGGDGGGGDGGGDGGGGDDGPVVLDLTGNGIKITQLGSSNTFMDNAGNGLQERTAWAGAGNGVLVLDLDGSSTVDQKQDFDFTSWDPGATSDMQALLDVFDTNHDGSLDSGDALFSDFRILVTNANGCTTLETLAQAGVASINLTTNNQVTTLADGSQINGETTYTMTNGGYGTAADCSFATDSTGYVTQQTVSTVSGATSIDTSTFNPDDSAAGQIVSSDGMTHTLLTYNGDGVLEQSQTDSLVLIAGGGETDTLSDYNGAGVLTDRTVTSTSADHNTVDISRYQNSENYVGQTESDVTSTNGLTATLTDLNSDSSEKDQTTTFTSANGSNKTISTDLNGDGTIDLTTTDSTVVNSGISVETVANYAGTPQTNGSDGTFIGKTVTTTGAFTTTTIAAAAAAAAAVTATSLTTKIQTDSTGDGSFDLTTNETITVYSAGNSVSTQIDRNADNSLRDETVTALSADGLTKTVQTDSDGQTNADGTAAFNLTTTDVTVQETNSLGVVIWTTETLIDSNANNSLRDQTVTIASADGRTRTIDTDSTGATSNGNSIFDRVETAVVSTATATLNDIIDTVTDYNGDGSFKDQTVTTTSANGLTIGLSLGGGCQGKVEGAPNPS